jgi:N-acyl homoserine lactone hydrolase
MTKLLLPLLAGCALTKHPTTPALTPAPTPMEDVIAFLATPGPIEHEVAVSGGMTVELSGLLNLDHPLAIRAGIKDAPTPVVLPVHMLLHPTAGLYVVDTGVDRDLAAGGKGIGRGLVNTFVKHVDRQESLGAMLDRRGGTLAGVLITHLHIDHVLGFPDIPEGTPIYVGEGETSARKGVHLVMRRTYAAALKGRAPLMTWDASKGVPLGPISKAWDVIGDGSLWALDTPGHTPGSTSYIARTTTGPVLFTGDTCHTLWGWESGVTPGGFTADIDANAVSLSALRELAASVPGMVVYVGHETDGEGTGVDEVADVPDIGLPMTPRPPAPEPPAEAAVPAGVSEG